MSAPQRDVEDDVLDPALAEADTDGGEAKTDQPPVKKRRRSVKPNLDKKFECRHEGCGKSYSRAEHLYRHQLNREYLGRHRMALR